MYCLELHYSLKFHFLNFSKCTSIYYNVCTNYFHVISSVRCQRLIYPIPMHTFLVFYCHISNFPPQPPDARPSAPNALQEKLLGTWGRWNWGPGNF